MSISVPDTTNDLWNEGQLVSVALNRLDMATNATITWTLPNTFIAYAGVLILLHDQPLTVSNFPVDGTRYFPSTDLNNPSSDIHGAIVVGAFYSDKITTSLNVQNLDPNKVYYVSAHAVSNVLQYYSLGKQSYPLDLKTDSFTGDIPSSTTPPLTPSLGQVYYNPNLGNVSMWNGTSWIPAGTGTVKTGIDFPIGPVPGQFFFNKINGNLYVFDGVSWDVANTEHKGIPMYAKVGVGTDGTYDERMDLLDIVKKQLGWPVVCVELSEDHFNIAIDNALEEFRRRTDNAYKRMYYTLPLKNQQDVYYLNDPVEGTNKIVDVIKTNRLSGLGLLTSGQNGVYNQAFLTQLFSPGFTDLTSIHLMMAYSEQFSMIFAGEIQFNWNEASRRLQLFRRIYKDEKILIECVVERTEQELLMDRYAQQWLQGWAVSEAKMTLGMIRSKFGTMVGAGGGVTMNGSELLASAEADQTELLRQIMDMEVGNGTGEFGNYSFVIG